MTPYEHLLKLHEEYQKIKFPEYSKRRIEKYRHKPNSTNGLTRCIVDYFKYIGGFAERTNTTGVYVQPKAKEGIKQRGYFRKTSATKGSSDIKAYYNGRAFMIEVKFGKDKQSEDQKKYESNITRAGIPYFIAKEFDSFYEWFNQYL